MIKNAEFKVEDVFGDMLTKESFSLEEITEPNKFVVKRRWILILVTLFRPRKKNSEDFDASASPEKIEFCKQMNSTETYCTVGRHTSNTNVIIENERVNPKNIKSLKLRNEKIRYLWME